MLESLFNKVAGLQDCCKTYPLHTHLRLYFSQVKTLKKYYQIYINTVLLNNVKCKVMFTEAYLEPSQTSMMELFCKNSKPLTILTKMLPHRCLTGF